MLGRLVLGLLKGLVLGGGIGAAVQYGLLLRVLGRLDLTSGGLLGALVAMGAAGTAGVFAGRPPWREGAWVEALIKGIFGVIVGGGAYWLIARYAGFAIPFPGVATRVPITALPVIFAPVVAGFYGSLVELDNSDDGKKKPGPKRMHTSPALVLDSADIEDASFDDAEVRTKPKGIRRPR